MSVRCFASGVASRCATDAKKSARVAGVSFTARALAMARAVGTQANDPKHTVVVDGVSYRYEPVFVWRKPDGWTPRRGKGIVIRAPRKKRATKARTVSTVGRK